jgi:type IV pilus assembly protein PilM
MAAGTGVWGIDLGQCALKAVKIRPAEDGKIEVVAFDVIEHPKILSQPDAEPDELIRAALEKFASRNDWQKDPFVIGVPGQQTFSRFSKLPPVDPKKLPELVKFEAGQQIPFEMSDVVWDYQVFQGKTSPEIEVGIFAMRKDLIRKYLDYFNSLRAAPVAIQTLPCALYNFVRFERQSALADGKATVIIDVGAQNTDLIIVEPNSAWMRNIPLGGNNFTETLVKAFKLPFSKAEALKRTAAESKYARQVFQAMRPVFADLVAEIQRSLGFYSSTHRDIEMTTVLACGKAFELPGLQKYLENNLTVGSGVERLEKFDKIVPNATINAPQFTANASAFGSALGLAVQGLGMAAISANLLPHELARVAMWRRKQPFFIAAAACMGLAAVFPWARYSMDKQALASDSSQDAARRAQEVIQKAQSFQRQFGEAQATAGTEKDRVEKIFELQKDRALVPSLVAALHEALPEVDPQILAADTPEKMKKLVASNPERFVRTKRKQIQLDAVKFEYRKDIDNFGGGEFPSYGSLGGGSGGGGGGGEGGAPAFASEFTGGRGGSRFGGERAPESGGGDSGGGEAAAAAGAPGFYVAFSGRAMYGLQPSEVSSFLNDELLPRIRAAMNKPGTGYFMPENDEKSDDKRNFRMAYPQPDSVAPSNQPALGGRNRGSELFAGQPEPGAAGAEVILNPDPVTGEDRSKDWLIKIAFKIKLGEAPPKTDAPADAGAAAGAKKP